MKIKILKTTSIDVLAEHLKNALPQYMIRKRLHPLFRFYYVEIKKTPLVGAIARYYYKTDKLYIETLVPATVPRILLGGLISLIFMRSSKPVVKAVASATGSLP